MKIENELKLDFNDVMFRPKRSTLSSRSEIDLTREITFNVNGKAVVWKGIPIIASNMDTIGTFEMYNVLSKYQMITCFHKHYAPDEFSDQLDRRYYMISTGISDNDYTRLKEIIARINPLFVCVDIANGYLKSLGDFVKKLHREYPGIIIACGNVVTREMVEELILNCNASIIKVGIGSGSCCTTRLQTGVGCPQLSAVIETSDSAHGINGFIISDGGCVHPCDVAKAFGGGADWVMLGNMLAGHTECMGELITENDKTYKLFYGMSSKTAMDKYHGGVAQYRSAEGKTVKVPYKGGVEETIKSILGGIRSTCTYIGARRLKDVPKCTTFLRVHN